MRTPENHHDRSSWLDLLTAGGPHGQGTGQGALPAEPLAIVALWDPFEVSPRQTAEAARAVAGGLSFPACPPGVRQLGVAARDVHVAVVSGCADESQFRRELTEACYEADVVAVFDVVGEVERAPASFGRLRDLFDVATMARQRYGPVVAVDQLLFLHGMTGSLTHDDVCRIVGRSWVGRLLASGSPKLFGTARAVFAAARWKLTDLAASLNLNEGTVRNHLAKLGELIGVDFFASGFVPVRFEDRFALELYELHDAVLPPLGDPAWSEYLEG